MKPMPPSSAMAVAIRAPVTLSMLAETTGNSRLSRRDSEVRRETLRRVLRGLSCKSKGRRFKSEPAGIENEGLADARSANPFRSPRLHRNWCTDPIRLRQLAYGHRQSGALTSLHKRTAGQVHHEAAERSWPQQHPRAAARSPSGSRSTSGSSAAERPSRGTRSTR